MARVFFQFEEENEVTEIELKLDHIDDDEIEIWTIIERFDCNVTGDLAFLATSQGREVYSTCRCIWCEAKASNWKRGIKKPKITLERLLECEDIYFKWLEDCEKAKASNKKIPKKPDTLGVGGLIRWRIDPSQVIAPMLHLKIGLLNLVLTMFRNFLDREIELIQEEEMGLRTSLRESNVRIGEMVTRMTELSSIKIAAYAEMAKLASQIETLTIQRMGYEEMNAIEQESLDQLEASVREKETVLKSRLQLWNEEFESLQRERPKLRDSIRQLKKDNADAKKKRIGDKDGLDTVMNKKMKDKAKVVPQAFFGGAINGVDCNRLLNCIDEILSEVKEEAVSRMRHDRYKEQGGTVTEDELERKFATYEHIFLVLDVVFALLRKPAPTNGEIRSAEEAIFVLKYLWIQEGISITPKAHVLFDHAIEQYSRVGGIADKAEDFVEKFHQTEKSLSHIVARMTKQCYKQKELIKIRRLFTMKNPFVKQQQEKVCQESKRKFKEERETAEEKNKRYRAEKRKEIHHAPFFIEILKLKGSGVFI